MRGELPVPGGYPGRVLDRSRTIGLLFNSVTFAAFLPVVLVVYYALSQRRQNLWLLAASYLFYGWWDWRFLSLILLSTLVDYAAGLGIDRSEREGGRKAWLAVSVVVNLGILGFFKYFNFFAESFAAMITPLGLEASTVTLDFVLPVGISFYTFQTMSYTIDVYRGRLAPARDPLTFALYVAYFPQLVAGPIERATRLLPQLQAPRRVTADHLSTGGVLILLGLFKKVVLADSVAGGVDAVFASPAGHSSAVLLRAAYLFTIQIYCDFSGYSDIARGVSRLFGIELMENFQQPYLSTNITEHWRRWHVSLSSWLRDYVYIPLGGNRLGHARTYVNVMTTMLLGGLWHGANWTFVIWGAIHGAYLVIHRALVGDRKIPERMRVTGLRSGLVFIVKLLVTMHLIVLTFVFFRSPNVGMALEYLWGIVSMRGGEPFGWLNPAMLLLLLLMVDVPQYLRRDHTVVLRASWPVRGGYYAFLLLTLVIMGGAASEPFIYFQF
ncbi:MAG: MBOAT family protein [Phycisphaerae bacterium]|nr:MBOAT family protein [Phycisphaerae bacterium]